MSDTAIANPASLVERVIDISLEAGREILRYYGSDYRVRNKSNNTPVTEADIAANEIILAGLQELTPNTPFVSEESSIPHHNERSKWQYYWLIDPLDGTKSFVQGDGEFTVNIALIEFDAPVLGVVHSPVEKSIYWGVAGHGAWRKLGDKGQREKIFVATVADNRVSIIAPRTRTVGRVQQFISNLESANFSCKLSHSSSSIKFCRVAEGARDIFPNLGTTSEWDTAAAQCVVECAGGAVTDLAGNRVRYNKADPKLHNPQFLVTGASDLDWRRFLPDD